VSVFIILKQRKNVSGLLKMKQHNRCLLLVDNIQLNRRVKK